MNYKKPIKITSIVILIIIGLLLLLPLAIDKEALKMQLEAKISQQLETKFEIRGNLGVAIFPLPKIFLNEIEVLNLKIGKKYSSDLAIEEAIIKTNFSSLLGGKVQIRELIVKKPKVTVRDFSLEEKKFQPNLSTSSSNFLNKIFDFEDGQIFTLNNVRSVKVIDGYISQISPKNKIIVAFEEVNFALKNNLKKQTLSAEGYFLTEGEPTNFSLFANTKNNTESSLKIQSAIFGLNVEGKFSNSTIDELIKSNFIGKVDIKINDLKSFLNKYLSRDSQIFRKISATKPVNIVADIENKAGKIDIGNMLIDSKLISGRGNIVADFSTPKPEISAAIDLNDLDIDGIWSSVAIGNSNFLDVETKIVQDFITKTTFEVKDENKTYLLKNVEEQDLQSAKVGKFDFKAKIKIKTAKYYGEDINDIHLNFITIGDNVMIEPLSANIPGKGTISINGIVGSENNVPKFVGNIQMKGDGLQETMLWAGIDLRNIKSGVLKEYDFNADLLLVPSFSIFNNLHLAINNNQNLVIGSLKIDDSEGISKISANLKMDYLNYDEYFKNNQKNTYFSKGSLLQKLIWLNAIKYDQDISLKIGKLIYQDYQINNGTFRVNIGQGYLKFSDLNFVSPKFNLSGEIGVDITKVPALNIDISSSGLEYEDLRITDRLFDLPDIGDFSGAIKIEAKEFIINNWQAKNIKIAGQNISGVVDFDQFDLEVYRGSAKFQGSMILKDLQTVNGSIQLVGVDSGLVLFKVLGIDNIRGASNLSVVINSSARNKKDFISNLSARGQFIGSNIEVDGFGIYDLALKAARPRTNYSQLQNPEEILNNPKSSSNFSEVSGSFLVSKGSGEDQFSIKAGSAGINSVISGVFDIESGDIDGTADLIFISGTRETQVPLRIATSFKGKSGSIKQVGNFTQIKQYLEQRLGDDYAAKNVNGQANNRKTVQ